MLKTLGPLLVRQGYRVLPIAPGGKAPPDYGWQNLHMTEAHIAQRVAQGEGGHGIGIITERTPAIDIDTHDPALAKQTVAWIEEHYGIAPKRVGNAPKILLLFRTEAPFTKVFSSAWRRPGEIDKNGKPLRHRLEVLGKGQQFVAFATHPDTKQPYAWIGGGNPLTMSPDELPLLTADAAREIANKFDEFAERAGMTAVRRMTNGPAPSSDDWGTEIVAKTDVTLEKAREILFTIPNVNDDAVEYEQWLEVGMAIWHQFDGSNEGYELFLDWSEQSWKHDPAKCQKSWRSFDEAGKGRNPITFRTVIKMAAQFKAEEEEARLKSLQDAFRNANTKAEFTVAVQTLKRSEFAPFTRNAFVPIVQETYQRIYNAKMAIAAARAVVKREIAVLEAPEWMKDWVYNRATETFYNTRAKQEATTRGFDNLFNARMLTEQERREGKAVPETRAADAALQLYQIPRVDGIRYAPGEPEIFNREGRTFVNSYDETGAAVMPLNWTRDTRAMADRLPRHVAHLVEDEREQAIILSWLAYIAQTRKRVPWAVVIQGTEKDGKTFFGRLMEQVLGVGNVNIINPKGFEKEFNNWAEASLLNVVDEIRVAGQSRWEIMDQIKPLITNSRIAVRLMRTDSYQTDNTASYLLLTNHQDALPVTAEASRYFVVNSRFQNQAAINAFTEANPDYYNELYELLDHAGAVRKFLMEYPLHPEFIIGGRAPKSSGLRYMESVTQSDQAEALHDILAEDTNHRICRDLVIISDLQEEIARRTNIIVSAQHASNMLMRAGFSKLGRIRDGADRLKCWTAYPELFKSDPVHGVSAYLKRGGNF